MDLCLEVRVDRRGRIGQAAVDEDEARLEGDEDAAVSRELDDRR
jgi:hypothetical protein